MTKTTRRVLDGKPWEDEAGTMDSKVSSIPEDDLGAKNRARSRAAAAFYISREDPKQRSSTALKQKDRPLVGSSKGSLERKRSGADVNPFSESTRNKDGVSSGTYDPGSTRKQRASVDDVCGVSNVQRPIPQQISARTTRTASATEAEPLHGQYSERPIKVYRDEFLSYDEEDLRKFPMSPGTRVEGEDVMERSMREIASSGEEGRISRTTDRPSNREAYEEHLAHKSCQSSVVTIDGDDDKEHRISKSRPSTERFFSDSKEPEARQTTDELSRRQSFESVRAIDYRMSRNQSAVTIDEGDERERSLSRRTGVSTKRAPSQRNGIEETRPAEQRSKRYSDDAPLVDESHRKNRRLSSTTTDEEDGRERSPFMQKLPSTKQRFSKSEEPQFLRDAGRLSTRYVYKDLSRKESRIRCRKVSGERVDEDDEREWSLPKERLSFTKRVSPDDEEIKGRRTLQTPSRRYSDETPRVVNGHRMQKTLPAAIIHEEGDKEHSVSTVSMKRALSDTEEPRDRRNFQKASRSYAEESPSMKDTGKFRKRPTKHDYYQNGRERPVLRKQGDQEDDDGIRLTVQNRKSHYEFRRPSREDYDQNPAGSRYKETMPYRSAGYDRHYYRTVRAPLETERPPEDSTTGLPTEDGRWTADVEAEDRKPSRRSTEYTVERDEAPGNKGRRDLTLSMAGTSTLRDMRSAYDGGETANLPVEDRGGKDHEPRPAPRHSARRKTSPSTKGITQPPAEKPATLSTTEGQVENGMKPNDKESSDDKNHLVDKDKEGAHDSVKQLLTVGEWLKILRDVPFDAPRNPATRPEPGGVESMRHLANRNLARSNLKVKRSLKNSRESLGKPLMSTPPTSSYALPHDTLLSVHTRDLESQETEDEGENEEEEGTAARRCECCYWFRFWSALGAFSMAVLLPLGVVLLPHTPHIAPHRDPGYDVAGDPGFRQSIEKVLNLSYNEDDFEMAPQSCDYAPYAAAHFGDVPSKTYRGANVMGTQYRHVICVFDSGYMWGSGTVTTFVYTPYDIQVQYCNAIVHYSMMIGQAGPQFKAGRLRGKKVSEALKALASSRHRGADVPVYLTLGGSWDDSYGIHEAVSNATVGKAVVDFVENNNHFYSGINIDWIRPGDACSQALGVGNPTVDFPSFVKLFRSRSLRVMLTVPPLPHLLGPYQLSHLLPELDYVVITTHKLRSSAEVTCAGERRLATAAFLRVRNLYASPSADSAVADKFVYSLSIAPDIYNIEETSNATFPAPIRNVAASFQGLQQWKSKTAYPFVCDLQVSDTKSDKECVMAMGHMKGEVAAFARAEDLCRRMRRAYDDGIGDAPVAVFDVQLDDPAGRCKLANSRGPLLRIVAEAGPFDC